MSGEEDEPYSDVPPEVTVGEGKEGFPEQSKYPLLVAAGLFVLGFGLSFPTVTLPFSSLFVIVAGAVITLWGVVGWAIEYAVYDYEDDVIPEQKRQLLGMETGTAAMWLFIVTEALLFAGLFLAYFYLRADYGPWPPSGAPPLDLRYALGLTVPLVLSGVTMYWAQRSIERGNRTGFSVGLGTTILLGSLFVVGQVYEYATMLQKGLKPGTGAYGSTFYVVTGTHGAHVLLGLVLLGIVGLRAWRRDHFDENRHLMVTTVGYYWHFVDGIWLFIVTFVYF